MSEHVVATTDQLGKSERVVIELKGREIAVFNVDNEYYAYVNWCAHQGGPVCEGMVTGRMEASFDRETLETKFQWIAEGETLICPWHDWEFDLKSGECLSANCELPSYPVQVEDNEIKITI